MRTVPSPYSVDFHKIERQYEGRGITMKITPVCSCGWRGRGYEAHNDYQYSNVMEQEKRHIDAVKDAVGSQGWLP